MQPTHEISSAHTRSRMMSILAIIGSAAFWGSATVMSRDWLDHFTAPTLLVIQLTSSALMLLGHINLGDI